MYSFLFISGTIEPQACPPGLVIDKSGAASETECDVCPAGKICPVGAVVPQPCWTGTLQTINFETEKFLILQI